MSILKVNTIQDKGGNAIISSDGSGNLTQSFASNTPAWFGEKTSNQTISRASFTKVTGMTTNEIDTDSAFDGTTFTVPSGKGGKYFIYFKLYGDYSTSSGNDGNYGIAAIYINGSSVDRGLYNIGSNNISGMTSIAQIIRTLNAGDTVEAYAYLRDTSGDSALVYQGYTVFGGYKIIGA